MICKERCSKYTGISNTRDALCKHVDKEDKNTVAFYDGNKGNPNQTVISESGFYSLVLSQVKYFRLDDKLNNESLLSLGQRCGWIINESGFYSLVLQNNRIGYRLILASLEIFL